MGGVCLVIMNLMLFFIIKVWPTLLGGVKTKVVKLNFQVVSSFSSFHLWTTYRVVETFVSQETVFVTFIPARHSGDLSC